MRRLDTQLFAPARGGLEALRALALCLVSMATFAHAALQAQTPPAGQPLRQQVEERFEVLPISGGLLLRPRQDYDGIRAVEVRDGELAIDGEDAEPVDLERRVGRAAAAPVLSLLELEDDELRGLFQTGPALSDTEAAARAEAQTPGQPQATPPYALPGSGAPFPPLPPIPPGLPDAERERLEREIERQHEEMRRRIEEAMEQRSDDMERAEEDMDRAYRDARRHGRSSSRERVIFGTPVRVAPHERTGQVVAIGGSVTVDGEVSASAVAVGGPVIVNGTVDEDVVSVGSGVRLGPQARVGGDVISVGGSIHRAPGAEVDGEVVEIGFWEGLAGGWGLGPSWDEHRYDYFEGSLSRFVRALVSLAVLLLVAALIAVFGKAGLERIGNQIAYEPWKAAVVGLLVIFLFVPVMLMVLVLLAISVIGIPLLLLWPFAVVGCFFLAFFGYLAAAHAVGRWSERRFGWRLRAPLTPVLMGLFLVHAPWVLARLVDVVDSSNDFAGFLVVTLWLFWFALNLTLLVIGTGGMMLGRKGGTVPATVPPVVPPPSTQPPLAPLGGGYHGGAAALGGAAAGAGVATGPTLAAAGPQASPAGYTSPAAVAAPAPATYAPPPLTYTSAATPPAPEPSAHVPEPDVAPLADAPPAEDWERRDWDEPFSSFDEPAKEEEIPVEDATGDDEARTAADEPEPGDDERTRPGT
jgi:hypothetical protein